MEYVATSSPTTTRPRSIAAAAGGRGERMGLPCAHALSVAIAVLVRCSRDPFARALPLELCAKALSLALAEIRSFVARHVRHGFRVWGVGERE
jgi:hypothetical protein